MALEGGDHVATDLPSRELGNLSPGDRLQISNRGQRECLRPGQLRNVIPSPFGMRSADRRREAGLVRNA